MGIRFPRMVKVRRMGYYGLPHRRARRFAMTGSGGAAVSRRRGKGTPPYGKQEMQWGLGRDDVGIAPYRGMARGCGG